MYVDALFDKNKDKIFVVERDNNGDRKFIDYPASYSFYFPDVNGNYKSIYGDKLAKFQTASGKAFAKEKKVMRHKKLFESDLNMTFKLLSETYAQTDAPKLHKLYFDIEVDFNKDLGFAPPSDPFNKITAIGVHLSWIDRTICLVIKPDTLSEKEAQDICDKFDDVLLMDSERDMLLAFYDLIEDADTISGWNSEGFDIPYVVNRTAKILGREATKGFCHWDQYPKKRKYEAYGKEQYTFDLVGRVHLDYMQLYRKYTYHEMHSYSLDTITEHELGEKKLDYDGTLDKLYNNDFEKFIAYNIQDTILLRKLDDKLQYIDLSAALAHANTVLIPTTMGAVAQTDQAIINEAHERNLIVPDKPHNKSTIPAAGAYVAFPELGLHKWIGSMDLNSLYPSILRSCNMSPECIVGQIRHTITNPEINAYIEKYKESPVAKYWEGKFACKEYELTMAKDKEIQLYIDFEDGSSYETSGAEIYDLIFANKNEWSLSSNGTIFSFEKEGVVPGLLSRWYRERQELQTKAKAFYGVDDVEYKFWDKRQLIRKINLNSLYGALLNPGSRFSDHRLGQSTTLTGRGIVQHMSAAVNEMITGEYNHLGDSIIYGDTDSVYFSAYPIFKPEIESGTFNWDKDVVVDLYDTIGAHVNTTFPAYMKRAHKCPEQYGKIIAAARETVSETGLFISKKRYGLMVYDDEGKRLDKGNQPGEIMVKGLEIKRSDTPTYMQVFLKDLLGDVLIGVSEADIIEKIKEFRHKFRDMPPWEKGTPKRVNNLTKYTAIWEKTGGCRVGHVKAAINYNRLLKMHSDQYSLEIVDGMKTIVCRLKDNPLKMASIAIPIDEKRIPSWYKELPFDDDAMEHAIITKKIYNLLGTLGWDLSRADADTTFDDLFSL